MSSYVHDDYSMNQTETVYNLKIHTDIMFFFFFIFFLHIQDYCSLYNWNSIHKTYVHDYSLNRSETVYIQPYNTEKYYVIIVYIYMIIVATELK